MAWLQTVIKNTGIVLSKKVVINGCVNYIPNNANADKRKTCVQHIIISNGSSQLVVLYCSYEKYLNTDVLKSFILVITIKKYGLYL